MAISPEEAREFTKDEALFMHGLELKIDTYIKSNGLGSGEDTLIYSLDGQDRQKLNNKTQAEIIKRYSDVGWNASFTMSGGSNNPKDFVLIDSNG